MVLKPLAKKQEFFLYLKIGFILLLIITASALFIIKILKERNLIREKSKTVLSLPKDAICIDPFIDETSIIAITTLIQSSPEYKDKIDIVNSKSDSRCTSFLSRNVEDSTTYSKVYSKVYVVVADFNSPVISISKTDLNNSIVTHRFNDSDFLWDNSSDPFIKSKYSTGVGYELPEIPVLKQKLKDDLGSIAIIPMDQLDISIKVIKVEDNSPLDRAFQEQRYPLIDKYWTKSNNSNIVKQITDTISNLKGEAIYSSDKLTQIILTGTSAIGASYQYQLLENTNNYTYPTNTISTTVMDADIAMINNASSFSQNCSQSGNDYLLCGKTESFNMIKNAGFDVVGVNGNRILDYGETDLLNTLKLYSENNLQYYGGGTNYDSSHLPATFDIKGNKIAFLGYNFEPPKSYQATNLSPGNASVDTDILNNGLNSAKSTSDIVIADMDWGDETSRDISDYQTEYGHLAIDSGANVVVGTHTHTIQPYEFYNGGVIFYSLGNFLYYDSDREESRYGVIVKLTIYNKKLINFEPIPTYRSDDGQITLASDEIKDKIIKEYMTLK